MSRPPLASRLSFADPAVQVERRSDGCTLLTSPYDLLPGARNTSAWLRHWSQVTPDQVFLSERHHGQRRYLAYGQAFKSVERIAQGLLSRKLTAETPVVVMSENSIDHALLALAAMHVGIPYIPVSTAYSLMSTDFEKLKAIVDLVTPGLVFVSDPRRYGPALEAIAKIPVALTDLMSEAPGDAVHAAHQLVGPDSIAKVLFTSGSTGVPKGVINTQHMLTVNQQQILQLWPFLSERPPVTLDWLPWNHTAGGNFNFNMMLANGGTLHIDSGKPLPGLFDETIAGLKETSPSIYFSVPRGYALLVPALQADETLRRRFFSSCEMIFYAGAALPQNLWEALEDMAHAECDGDLALIAAWGSTETAPMATSVHYSSPRAGIIGLPAPGCELKLVPSGGKQEVRLRGPGIFPGYFRRDDLTLKAFDEEGYYMIGDALRLADPDNPTVGIEFDGRIAENFKLRTGTWVHVGWLRISFVSIGTPIVMDAVITGHDRDEVGALIFLNPAADAGLSTSMVREKIAQLLLRFNDQAGGGSSTRIARAMIMNSPPDPDRGEITDKGYLNQRAILDARAGAVVELYEGQSDAIIMPRRSD